MRFPPQRQRAMLPSMAGPRAVLNAGKALNC